MKRLILLACLAFLSVTMLDAQEIYFFSVGVTDYPGDSMDLRFPAKDAKAMNRLYRRQGCRHTYLLTDKNATRSTIMSKARQMFNQAKAEDIVIFYFSGHGYPGGFAVYDGDLTYQDVKSVFSQCKSKNKMIFADACFAGDFRQKGSSTKAREDLSQSVMLFLSSRDDETSKEGTIFMNNGVFTACLLSGLKGGADQNRDRVITAWELFKAVSEGVRKMTYDEQHPVMWGKFDKDMPVMVWR